jgi:hypothetical protein
MTEFCSLTHAESGRRVVQTPAIGSDYERLLMADCVAKVVDGFREQ